MTFCSVSFKKTIYSHQKTATPMALNPSRNIWPVSILKLPRYWRSLHLDFMLTPRTISQAKRALINGAFVGFQGIADMACRLDEDDNITAISQAMPQLPPQPFEALCQCLEHEIISDELAQILGQCLDTELSYDEPNSNFHFPIIARRVWCQQPDLMRTTGFESFTELPGITPRSSGIHLRSLLAMPETARCHSCLS